MATANEAIGDRWGADAPAAGRDAERRRRHSHAERGNENVEVKWRWNVGRIVAELSGELDLEDLPNGRGHRGLAVREPDTAHAARHDVGIPSRGGLRVAVHVDISEEFAE